MQNYAKDYAKSCTFAHKARETSIKLRAMHSSAHRETTSSSESGDSNAGPFAEQPEAEFSIPTPASLSDNDEPSPSLYRMGRANAAADESFDEKSEMEEEKEAKLLGKKIDKSP